MAEVTLENVVKVYPGNVTAVIDFNLTIADGEFVVLVGPSGCGKSTTLRMVAGLEEITQGTIKIAGRVVNDVPPKDRDIAMVFQNYALYPHMSVYDNMAFGLKLRKFPKKEIQQRIKDAARILGIEELMERRPKALSGGQRQRVAVGRAIVRKPAVFLFDEPLSNLDATLRVQMRGEIRQLHRQLDATMIYVTHDQVEAMTMGDRIVVMREGIVHQVADPITLYDDPVDKFVASFIGTPPMNFIDGKVTGTNGRLQFVANTGLGIPLPSGTHEKLGNYREKPVTLGIRPEDVGSVLAEQAPNAPRLKAKLDVLEPMGSESYLYLSIGENQVISRADSHKQFQVGTEIDVPIVIDKARYFDSDSEKRIA